MKQYLVKYKFNNHFYFRGLSNRGPITDETFHRWKDCLSGVHSTHSSLIEILKFTELYN